MPVHTVSIEPSPLTAGKKGKILYDGPDGTEITLDWGRRRVRCSGSSGSSERWIWWSRRSVVG